MVDAGWNADPSGRFAQRYWDGARWTEHVVDGGGSRLVDGPAAAAAIAPVSKAGPIVMVVSAVAAALGSTMPWATAGLFSKAGTDGDGMLTLLAAIVAGGVAGIAVGAVGARVVAAVLGMLAGIGIAAVAAYDFLDVSNTEIIEPGSGLIVTGLGGVALVVGAIVTLAQRR